MRVRSTSAASYRGQKRRRGCRTKISPSSTLVTSQQPCRWPRSQQKTHNKHTNVTIPLIINASSRQRTAAWSSSRLQPKLRCTGTEFDRRALLPWSTRERSSISGLCCLGKLETELHQRLRCIGQPGNGAPSEGFAASASPGTDPHQRARLVNEARRHLPPTSWRRMDSLRRIQRERTSVVGGQSGGPTPRDKASLREAVME